MSKLSDPEYLLSKQYKDATNLNARLSLHQKFSTNKYDWFLWLFDHLDLRQGDKILELGCGPGDLWRSNYHRIPDDCDITLSDFSVGMLQQAKNNLLDLEQDFSFKLIDAQAIPYYHESFDIVIANFMLYHVANRGKALSEIRRVLKLGGRLIAATAGKSHLGELPVLVSKFDPKLTANHEAERNGFTLENGYSQLTKWFSDVSTYRQTNALIVTEVSPLVDYVLSTVRLGVGEERRDEFSKFVEYEMMLNRGEIHITKDSGLFIATNGGAG